MVAYGKLGGLIFVWDKECFEVIRIICEERMIIVEGKWKDDGEIVTMINVYAPNTTID